VLQLTQINLNADPYRAVGLAIFLFMTFYALGSVYAAWREKKLSAMVGGLSGFCVGGSLLLANAEHITLRPSLIVPFIGLCVGAVLFVARVELAKRGH
jgi:hypothetical protein